MTTGRSSLEYLWFVNLAFFLTTCCQVYALGPAISSTFSCGRNACGFLQLRDRSLSHRVTQLYAKKKKKGKPKPARKPQSSSGFGGAAAEPCPCGSGLGYMKCCGKLHKDADAYAAATAEQVVRARYSAYSKREIDFIMGSTHPLNENFMSDIQHWKETIKNNCYDNFELTRCQILNETYEGEGDKEVATVQFVANMIQVDSREKTAFMETSTFERGGKHIRNGAWLYRDGTIESPPGEEEEAVESSSERPTKETTIVDKSSPNL